MDLIVWVIDSLCYTFTESASMHIHVHCDKIVSLYNQVSLEFRSSSDSVITEAEPGDDVKVRVETEAGSTVGLLSVDKSVLLLGGGNDITQSQVAIHSYSPY